MYVEQNSSATAVPLLGALSYLLFVFVLVMSCHASLINKKHIT